MRYFFAIYFFAIVAVVSILGFRGSKSEKPPLWIFPDMDNQAKYKPQSSNDFFENRMDDRPKPANIVLRGQYWDLKEVFSEEYNTHRFDNPALYYGKNVGGEWAEGFPITVDNQAMELGRRKYEIFCTVCHGAAGDGAGATSEFGISATNLRLEMFREMPEGQIFNTITNGKGTMYGYGDRITPEERWAIILYVRALQQSQNATAEDIPPAKRKELGL